MLHLSNFSGCIIHPGSLYNGRLNTLLHGRRASMLLCTSKEGPPHSKNLPSTKKVSNNNSDGAIVTV